MNFKLSRLKVISSISAGIIFIVIYLFHLFGEFKMYQEHMAIILNNRNFFEFLLMRRAGNLITLIIGLIFYLVLIYVVFSFFQKSKEINQEVKKKSKLAIISFVLSLISFIPMVSFSPLPIPGLNYLSCLSTFFGGGFVAIFLVLPMISLTSIILGIISLFLIKKHFLEGKKYAIIAIILGFCSILFPFLIFISVFSKGFPFW